ARGATRRPHGRPAPALRRLLASDAVPHPAASDRRDAADPHDGTLAARKRDTAGPRPGAHARRRRCRESLRRPRAAAAVAVRRALLRRARCGPRRDPRALRKRRDHTRRPARARSGPARAATAGLDAYARGTL